MKKEYIILILLILGLGAYLGLKKDDRIHYDLPVPAKVDTQTIDRIEITKNNNTISFAKSENGWTLTDQKFPADQAAVDTLLGTIKALTISALVSEAGDRVRYELDKSNAIQVIAFEGKNEKRHFTIGKTAPSFNHTFVMLDGDKRIFQADKSFRNNFDKTVDEFRDKLILESEAKTIQKITLERGEKVICLVPVKTASESEEKEKTPGTLWQVENGKENEKAIDQAAVSDLITSLSRLEGQEFLNEADAKALEKETALCKITLENKAPISLSLFKLADKEDMAGTASTSPYAFSLASYKAKDIVSYVNKILGLTENEASKSDPE